MGKTERRNVKMGKRKASVLITSFVVATFFVIACTGWVSPSLVWAADKPPIKVGIVFPISGVMSTIALPAYKAHVLAMSEINEKGGLLGGRKFEWIVRDSMGKPENETRYCREMLVSEKVDILHAGFGSSLGLAASAVVKEAGRGLAFLEGGKTSKLRNEKFDKRVFYCEQQDVSEALGMAKALCEVGPLKDIKNPKIYFLSWDYEYGRSLFRWFVPALKKYRPGAQILESWTKVGETDYSPYLSMIASAKPDVVVTTIWGGGIPTFLKQADIYGLWDITKLFASTEVAGVEYLGEVGELFPVGTWVNVMEQPDVPGNAEQKKYWANYRKMFNGDPGAFGARNYVATYLLAKAIEDAGTLDPEKLIPALENAQINSFLGKVWMRKINHQMQTGMYWGPLLKAAPPYYRTLDKANLYWLPDSDVTFSDEEIMAIRGKK